LFLSNKRARQIVAWALFCPSLAMTPAVRAAEPATGSLPYACQGAQRSAGDTPIRLTNTLVTLGVGVTNKKGNPIANLSREDFILEEDQRRQDLAFFAKEDEPISFGLILDRSQSMGDGAKLERAKAAAMAFLRAGNPSNEAFCIALNDTVTLLSDFTSDYSKVQAAIADVNASGGTALYDAIVAGLDKLLHSKHRRRALVIITDGCDQHSRSKLSDVINRVQQSDAQVYTVGFFSRYEATVYQNAGTTIPLMDGRQVDNPQYVFRTLAEETGAETFFPESADQMDRVMSNIATSLRRQYTLAYYPPDQNDYGRYRKIRVTLAAAGAARWIVQTRMGYRLTAPDRAERAAPSDAAPTAPANNTYRSEPQAGPERYAESFSDPSSGWPISATSFYKDGSYHLTGKQVVPVRNYLYADFDASVNIESIREEPTSSAHAEKKEQSAQMPVSAGLAFRITGAEYYVFLISPPSASGPGVFKLAKIVNGRMVEITGWRQHQAIVHSNRMAVRCTGPRIELYANDELLVAAKKETSSGEGRLALVVTGGHAIFSDLVINKLQPRRP
jgi:Ca-activated chloride channel family protein